MNTTEINIEKPSIRLTEAAVKATHELVAEDPMRKEQSLRLYLEGKGCDGFYYGVSFDSASEEDLHFPHEGIDLVADPDTYEFCKGSIIDWVDDERGRGFLVDNPEHRKFRGKFYKRKVWQERLQEKKSKASESQH